ncbi:nucleotide-binding alpha-beta plait domain-containing protein [Tanacetum coccineum]
MGTFRSKEDDVQQISTSVFVTNFPDQFSAKDLWNTCKQYGYVVDAFIPNRKSKAGFNNIDLKYMGGYWVMIKFQSKEAKKTFQSNVEKKGVPLQMWYDNTFKRIASKWGTLIHANSHEDGNFYTKRICINTNNTSNILESFKIIYRGKLFWVRAKEVPGWEPDFMEDNDDNSDNDDDLINDLKKDEELEGDSDTKAVPYITFDDPIIHIKAKMLYFTPIIDNVNSEGQSNKFTSERLNNIQEEVLKDSSTEEAASPHVLQFKNLIFSTTGGSILQVMEEMVKDIDNRQMLEWRCRDRETKELKFPDQIIDLECDVSKDEIKRGVTVFDAVTSFIIHHGSVLVRKWCSGFKVVLRSSRVRFIDHGYGNINHVSIHRIVDAGMFKGKGECFVLNFCYPRLSALKSCKNIDVASKLSQNSLAFTFRREPRGGVEQDQFDSLKAMMEGTSLFVNPSGIMELVACKVRRFHRGSIRKFDDRVHVS